MTAGHLSSDEALGLVQGTGASGFASGAASAEQARREPSHPRELALAHQMKHSEPFVCSRSDAVGLRPGMHSEPAGHHEGRRASEATPAATIQVVQGRMPATEASASIGRAFVQHGSSLDGMLDGVLRIMPASLPQSVQGLAAPYSLHQVKTFTKYNLSERELLYKQRLQRRGKEAASASVRKAVASRPGKGLQDFSGKPHVGPGMLKVKSQTGNAARN